MTTNTLYFIKIKDLQNNSESIINKKLSIDNAYNSFYNIFNFYSNQKNLKEVSLVNTDKYKYIISKKEDKIIKGYFYHTKKYININLYELSLIMINDEFDLQSTDNTSDNTSIKSSTLSTKSVYDTSNLCILCEHSKDICECIQQNMCLEIPTIYSNIKCPTLCETPNLISELKSRINMPNKGLNFSSIYPTLI